MFESLDVLRNSFRSTPKGFWQNILSGCWVCNWGIFSTTFAVHIKDCEGWWLSNFCSSAAEHWLHKPGVESHLSSCGPCMLLSLVQTWTVYGQYSGDAVVQILPFNQYLSISWKHAHIPSLHCATWPWLLQSSLVLLCYLNRCPVELMGHTCYK